MPVKNIARHRAVLVVAAVAFCVLLAGVADAVAQSSPFGTSGAPAQSVPAGGLLGWIFVKQAEFYRGLSAAIRSAKADGSAIWGLFGLSFAYGIFHAAGPGHGKGVISSYLVANQETWKRGVVLSFVSAMLQALVAVAIVGVAAALLNATAKTMAEAVRYIEIVSYVLIVLVGLRLLWTKGRGFIAAWQGASVTHDAHDHAHSHHHDHDHHHGHAHHDHAHDHGHAHDEHCGHSHGPEPVELAGPGGWSRGFAAIVAVGVRPCSGAIIVLVFALAQGLFWAGVGATFIMGLGTAITVAAIATFAVGAREVARRFAVSRPGGGTLFLRGIEVGAAVLVILFGVGLLTGYLISERIMGFA